MNNDMKQADFWCPSLEEAAAAIHPVLEKTYAEVSVSVGPCPDLRDLGCAFAGLGGNPFIVEIGGEPLVHNPQYRDDGSFDLANIMQACDRPNGKILGAGFPSLVAMGGKCGELMPCLELQGQNLSKVARVGPDKECIVQDYPSHLHGGLGNLYVSDGAPGDVIEVEVRQRIGTEASLPRALRDALGSLVHEQAGKEIAMGGVFSVLEGQIRAHVSPDFECIAFPYYDPSKEEVTRPDFLQLYDGMGPNLMCMSVLWTGDPKNGALNLRPSGEHTHFFSTKDRAEAGHYHHDMSPETIHYKGYFQLAEKVFRVADIYEKLGKPLG